MDIKKILKLTIMNSVIGVIYALGLVFLNGYGIPSREGHELLPYIPLCMISIIMTCIYYRRLKLVVLLGALVFGLITSLLAFLIGLIAVLAYLDSRTTF